MTLISNKLVFLISSLFLMFNTAYSQNRFCGTDEVRKKMLEKSPEIINREAAFDRMAAERLSSIMRMDGDKLIIPVVFHIIHDYGEKYILHKLIEK